MDTGLVLPDQKLDVVLMLAHVGEDGSTLKQHWLNVSCLQGQHAVEVHCEMQWGIVKPFSAGTDFRRHNLTSVDVRLWRLKSIPALKEYTVYNGLRPIT